MTTHNHGGRPPKSPAKRTARKTVTLRQEQIGAVQLLQDGEEEFSTTLQRLLDTHPDVIAMLEWQRLAAR